MERDASLFGMRDFHAAVDCYLQSGWQLPSTYSECKCLRHWLFTGYSLAIAVQCGVMVCAMTYYLTTI